LFVQIGEQSWKWSEEWGDSTTTTTTTITIHWITIIIRDSDKIECKIPSCLSNMELRFQRFSNRQNPF
jgi:hypothetical protein